MQAWVLQRKVPEGSEALSCQYRRLPRHALKLFARRSASPLPHLIVSDSGCCRSRFVRLRWPDWFILPTATMSARRSFLSVQPRSSRSCSACATSLTTEKKHSWTQASQRVSSNSRGVLKSRLETEYAATRAVRPPAYGQLTVRWRNRHRLVERHQLALDHPAGRVRRRARVAFAVVVAATPLTRGVFESTAVDPAVMRGRDI